MSSKQNNYMKQALCTGGRLGNGLYLHLPIGGSSYQFLAEQQSIAISEEAFRIDRLIRESVQRVGLCLFSRRSEAVSLRFKSLLMELLNSSLQNIPHSTTSKTVTYRMLRSSTPHHVLKRADCTK